MRVIPKGWLKYQAMGEQIAGTKMVPFKVPLTEEACSRVPDDQWFTPDILLQRHPGLKIVIDLTDTTRYYDPQEFSRKGIVHVKIRITGGGALPSLRMIRLFFRTVDDFMKKYAHDSDALVGVHCTHGLNRTGYFICHYMVDRLGMSPDDAIAKFEAARGHTMHRQNFINEIKNCKGKVSNSKNEEGSGIDRKKTIEYSSPLGDTLEDYIDNRSSRGSYRKREKSFEDWRKRDTSNCGGPNVPSFRNFYKNNSKSRISKDLISRDKNKHNLQKRFSKEDKRTGSTSHYQKDACGTSSGGSCRDRP